MIAILLHDLFPLLSEGPATVSLTSSSPDPFLQNSRILKKLIPQTLKATLVSNATLARISDAYGIPAKLRAEPSATRMTRTQIKTRASMFEAWIAGIFYSVLHGKASEEGEEGEGGYEGSDESEEKVDREPTENGKSRVPADDSTNSEEQVEKVDPSSLPKAKPVEHVPATESAKSAVFNAEASPSSTQEQSSTDPAPLTATSIEEPDDTASSPTSSQTPSDSTISLTSAFQHLKILSNQNLKYRWVAMIALDDWLRPLFTPIAQYALAELRKEQVRLTALEEEHRKIALSDMVGIGSVGLLNTHVNQGKIGTLAYEAAPVEEGWQMTLTLVKADGSVV
jgi:hypothetical protein